jgi:hypothetical protein
MEIILVTWERPCTAAKPTIEMARKILRVWFTIFFLASILIIQTVTKRFVGPGT